jgi:hypothetical protein
VSGAAASPAPSSSTASSGGQSWHESTRSIATLQVAISPYHLGTREAPAMLGLLLGARAFTILPEPPSGSTREDVHQAAHLAPRFLRLMESWEWCGPLWRAGVLSGHIDSDHAFARLAQVYDQIHASDRLAVLRRLIRRADELSDAPFAALDALASDLLRAGPDPGLSIPMTAALDAFALSHGLVVVRSSTVSLVQRAEQHLSQRLCSFGIPMLSRAGGSVLLRAREALARELDELRAALVDVVRESIAPRDGADRSSDRSASRRAMEAAGRFAERFNAWALREAAGDDEMNQRIVSGFASVTLVKLPADAALRSGQAAARAVHGTSGGGGSAAESDPPSGTARLFAMIVRELDVKPA